MKTLFETYTDAEHSYLFAFLESRKEACYAAASERKKDITFKYEGDKLEDWWMYDKFAGVMVYHHELGMIEVRADNKMVVITWVIGG
jgi:hypothetical protein